MPLLTEGLLLFRDLLSEARRLTQEARLDSRNPQHLLAGSLHAAVLERARGVATLLEGGDAACAFVVLRSLLEASIDLFNVVDDPQYAEFMNAAFLDQKRRVLNAATQAASTNPYLSLFADPSIDIPANLSQVRGEIADLKARGFPLLSVEQRFQRAKQLELYQGPYAYLCWQSHNNINSLEERHIVSTPAGVAVRYFAAPSDEDVLLALDTAGGILANSVSLLHQLANPSGWRTVTKDLTSKLEVLRAFWHKPQ